MQEEPLSWRGFNAMSGLKAKIALSIDRIIPIIAFYNDDSHEYF